MRETNRRRLRSVAERVRQERWEMVLLTELRADEEGVVWLGEDEDRGVLIHRRKAGLPGWLPPRGGSGSARGSPRCVKKPPRPRGPLHQALERVPG